MRVPLSWLRDFAPFDGDAVPPWPPRSTTSGWWWRRRSWWPRASATWWSSGSSAIDPIEGADRIRLVVVDDGRGPVEVVCGAWNFEVGDLVPLAPVGAVLPGGFEIGRRKMKGVVSNGMLCSGRELKLSDDHEGILRLNEFELARRGPSSDRGPRGRTRCGLRHRRRGQPPRRLVHGRGGPGPGGPARSALRHPRDGGSGAGCHRRCRGSRTPGPGPSGGAAGGHPGLGPGRRPRPLSPAGLPGGHRGTTRPFAGLAGPTTDPGRDEADQQRGRRVQLRDARARATHPSLRSRPAPRSRPGRATGAAGGDRGDPRRGGTHGRAARSRARRHRRGLPHLRRRGIAGGHRRGDGRRLLGDRRRDRHRCSSRPRTSIRWPSPGPRSAWV